MHSLWPLASLALLPITWALTFVNPGHPSNGQTIQVSWSTVDSDPPKFDLVLANLVKDIPLLTGVDTASRAVTVRIPCDIYSTGANQL